MTGRAFQVNLMLNTLYKANEKQNNYKLQERKEAVQERRMALAHCVA